MGQAFLDKQYSTIHIIHMVDLAIKHFKYSNSKLLFLYLEYKEELIIL